MAFRVAVINDDTRFLTLMCELLAEDGYEAYTIREADAAYEKLKANPPDAIVLDIRIEHSESGWTILELVKLDPALARIPVIVCSADSRALQDGRERLERYGCRILPKPFDIDELTDMLRQIFADRAH